MPDFWFQSIHLKSRIDKYFPGSETKALIRGSMWISIIALAAPAVLFTVMSTLSAQGRGVRLTRTFLSSQYWGREDRSLGMHLAFDRDGGYTKSREAPGGKQCNGRYLLRENKLTLLPGSSSGSEDVRCTRRVCRLYPSRASLYRRFRLVCKGERSYWALNQLVPAGEKRFVRRRLVITTGPRRALLTAAASVRYSPRVKSRKYACRRASGRIFRSFRKGHDFLVLARTEKKLTTGYTWKRARKRRRRRRRWSKVPRKHFWYYVNLNTNRGERCPRREGWISGSLLRFKPSSKSAP